MANTDASPRVTDVGARLAQAAQGLLDRLAAALGVLAPQPVPVRVRARSARRV